MELYPWYFEPLTHGILTPYTWNPLSMVCWPLTLGTPFLWYFEPPIHGILNPYPWYLNPLHKVFGHPYPWYFDPLPMVYRTPYPWHIESPTHGMLTPVPMVYRTPYPWYIEPPWVEGQITMVRGSIYHG